MESPCQQAKHNEYNKGPSRRTVRPARQLENVEGRAIVNSIIGRLLWVRKPTPPLWCFEAERMTDMPFP
jgi:hypothetical protein